MNIDQIKEVIAREDSKAFVFVQISPNLTQYFEVSKAEAWDKIKSIVRLGDDLSHVSVNEDTVYIGA